jgi:hypothetical protein
MKTTLKNGDFGNVIIPRTVISDAGLQGEKLDCYAENAMLYVIPAELNAKEIIDIAKGFHNATLNLMRELTAACGICTECGVCEVTGLHTKVNLPEALLEDAGLNGVKLEFSAKQGEISITEADHDCDLSDVDEQFMGFLKDSNICLRKLDELLIDGGIIKRDTGVSEC